MTVQFLVGFALSVSLSGNALLLLHLRKLKKTAPLTTDARAMLHDLTSSAALVKVTRVDPQDILIRSPRGF